MDTKKIKIITIDLEELNEGVTRNRIYEIFDPSLLDEIKKFTCPVRLMNFLDTQEIKEQCQELFRYDLVCDIVLDYVEITKHILKDGVKKKAFEYGGLNDPIISYIAYTNSYGY